MKPPKRCCLNWVFTLILKNKRRHILVRMSGSFAIGNENNWNELRNALLLFLGEQAFSEARPKLIRILGPDRFIMGCARGSEDRLVLALSFVKRLGSERLGFYTLKTSGTIKGLLSKARKSGSQQKQISRAL